MALTDKERAYYRAYYQAHKEKLLAKTRKFYYDNWETYHSNRVTPAARKEEREYRAVYRKSRRDTLAAYYRDYYAKNLEDLRVYHRIKRHEYSPRRREFYRNNVGKCRLLARVAYERFRQAGKLTKELIQQVYERNIAFWGRLTCYLCHKPIKFGDDNLEHKTPIIRGGKNSLGNLDIAHSSCNFKKGVRTYEECLEIKLFSV